MDTLSLALLIYLPLLNLITFIIMGLDKRKAKRKKWRVSESALLTLCFFGGALGGLFGMLLFHHKTRHIKFTVCIPLFLVVQIAGVVYLYWSGLLHLPFPIP